MKCTVHNYDGPAPCPKCQEKSVEEEKQKAATAEKLTAEKLEEVKKVDEQKKQTDGEKKDDKKSTEKISSDDKKSSEKMPAAASQETLPSSDRNSSIMPTVKPASSIHQSKQQQKMAKSAKASAYDRSQTANFGQVLAGLRANRQVQEDRKNDVEEPADREVAKGPRKSKSKETKAPSKEAAAGPRKAPSKNITDGPRRVASKQSTEKVKSKEEAKPPPVEEKKVAASNEKVEKEEEYEFVGPDKEQSARPPADDEQVEETPQA